jgi:urate oxidase
MTISYGKEAISVYRTDGARSLVGAEVSIEIFGENLMPAYTDGDNSLVVATDTMKNFVLASSRDYEGDLEGLLAFLGQRFLETYGHFERIRVRGRELPFARESDLVYRRLYDDHGVAEVTLDAGGILDHRSGREAIHLVKIAGSSFAGFPRDEYTTLPEARDRPLFVHVDVHWRHADFERRVPSELVRESVVRTFDAFVSQSIQHLVHEMGSRALEDFAEIREVSFEAENRLWDSGFATRDGARQDVYTDPRPPFGRITLVLGRSVRD